MQQVIKTAIENVLQELGVSDVAFVVEHPADLSHGDYACNAAMVAAKQLGKNPRELAEEIVAKLEGKIDSVAKIEIAGPGFINFHLTRDFFKEKITQIHSAAEAWGTNDSLKGKRIMVEYTDPNPFKVFHIGHLMSNAIGESISRLIAASGADVFRANYQGDVGRHIGMALWGLRDLGYDPSDIAKLGEAYAHGHAQFDENESVKAEIIALTKAVYAKDESILEEYTKGRTASLEKFEELYRRLGTNFDHLFFESEVWEMGERIVRDNVGTIFTESDGAIVYEGEQDGLHTRVFINSEGVTTYEAKDLGLAYAKKERWEFDESITVTAVEQDQYFKVVFAALSKIDSWFRGKMKNIPHGMMQLSDGKMSSRKGKIVGGEDMLNDAKDAARLKIADNEEIEDKDELADAVGVAAIKYLVLKQSLGKNITYDLERALSFEGDSGPYLQYTHARINSVLEKAKGVGVEQSAEVAPNEPYNIEKLLYRYPEVVREAAEEQEPHKVTTFLTELAGAFNSFYATEKIADASDEFAPYKAAVAAAVGQTLKNGLYILGIKAPEKM